MCIRDRHIDDIEAFIYDLEDDLGESITLDHPRYNSAVWLVTEPVSYTHLGLTLDVYKLSWLKRMKKETH